MANPGDVLALSPTERLTILTTTAESGGELLAMEARYEPSKSPPPEHYHPQQEERFTGLSGTITARVAGVERTISPGETLTIPARTRHAFWNPGSDPATIRWEVRPALNTERMFEELAQAGSRTKQALVLPRYRREFRLNNTPQRVLLDLLGPLANRIAARR